MIIFIYVKERWNQSNRNSWKLQQDIIEYLGRKNYIAVDINNQIDMVRRTSEKILQECAKRG